MSCLNLRLPPAKKVWKSFTSKLQTKLLHKLHKSKAIKKPSNKNNRFYAKSAERPTRQPPISFDHKRKRLVYGSCKKSRTSSTSTTSHFHLQRKNSPAVVYIDRLFQEVPAKGVLVKCQPSAKNTKIFIDDHGPAPAGISKAKVEGGDAPREIGVDDMWESLGFGSPQMQGIDERAEEFISSFRAEMKQQEKIAQAFR